MLRMFCWLVRTAWTLPTTLVGLILGVALTPLGVRWRVRRGTLECFGEPVRRWVLQPWWRPGGNEMGFMAITLGDVILGVSGAALDAARDHEQVHVRQAHRWGPLFIPAYLAAGGWAWARGRRAYFDNPFERQAYGESNPHDG